MIIAFTWLWQGLLLAALTTVALRAMPRLNAASRHLTWWAALAGVFCIPLVLAASTVRDVLPGSTGHESIQPALVLPAAPDWVSVLGAAAWLLAAVGGVTRVAFSCRAVRTLRRRSTPFDTAREARLPLWSDARLRARRCPELRMSHDLAGACALGFRRPIILVGRPLADGLDDAALDQIVMHEHAHVARYDDWLRLLQAAARAIGGLHPAVWWLSHRIDRDREAACDDFVVARTGAARQYASALVEAAIVAGPGPAVPCTVPGATSRGSALRLRVARLLDPSRAPGVRATPIAAMAMVLPVVAVLACPRLAPLVAFVDAVELALPLPHRSGVAASALPSAQTGAAPVTAEKRAREANRESMRTPVQDGTRDASGTAAVPPAAAVPALPAIAPALIESRRLLAGVSAPLLAAAPAATINGFAMPAPLDQASGRATSSIAGAKSAASRVASGAGRRGLAIGRAFARAGQAVAGSF